MNERRRHASSSQRQRRLAHTSRGRRPPTDRSRGRVTRRPFDRRARVPQSGQWRARSSAVTRCTTAPSVSSATPTTARPSRPNNSYGRGKRYDALAWSSMPWCSGRCGTSTPPPSTGSAPKVTRFRVRTSSAVPARAPQPQRAGPPQPHRLHPREFLSCRSCAEPDDECCCGDGARDDGAALAATGGGSPGVPSAPQGLSATPAPARP